MRTVIDNLLFSFLFLCFFVSCNSSTEKKGISQDTLKIEQKLVVEKIKFPSLDKLPVTANLYLKDESYPFIVLCHMAGFNKSEYKGIAKKLTEQGFNCLAVDQRSGGTTSGGDNETWNEAVRRELSTEYLDAKQDIVAAINYVYNTYDRNCILWGSSYSASLALIIGKSNSHVDAVMAFSPGEYFSDSLSLKNSVKDYEKPVFITSSRNENNWDLKAIIKAVGEKNVTHFQPKGNGEHGSVSLWDDNENNYEYWDAVEEFLKKFK